MIHLIEDLQKYTTLGEKLSQELLEKAEKARSHFFYLQLHFIKSRKSSIQQKVDWTGNCLTRKTVKKRSIQMTHFIEGWIKNKYLQFSIFIQNHLCEMSNGTSINNCLCKLSRKIDYIRMGPRNYLLTIDKSLRFALLVYAVFKRCLFLYLRKQVRSISS